MKRLALIALLVAAFLTLFVWSVSADVVLNPIPPRAVVTYKLRAVKNTAAVSNFDRRLQRGAITGQGIGWYDMVRIGMIIY